MCRVFRSRKRPCGCPRIESLEQVGESLMNRRIFWMCCGLVWIAGFCPQFAAAQKPFTLEQILSAPFADNLTAAKNVNRIAWTLDEEGKRNIWVAEGPAFQA